MDAKDQYGQLRQAYKKAEDAIHNLGVEGVGADVVAINELAEFSGEMHGRFGTLVPVDTNRDDSPLARDAHLVRPC